MDVCVRCDTPVRLRGDFRSLSLKAGGRAAAVNREVFDSSARCAPESIYQEKLTKTPPQAEDEWV